MILPQSMETLIDPCQWGWSVKTKKDIGKNCSQRHNNQCFPLTLLYNKNRAFLLNMKALPVELIKLLRFDDGARFDGGVLRDHYDAVTDIVSLLR